MEDIIMLQETKATQQNNKEYYVRMIDECYLIWMM